MNYRQLILGIIIGLMISYTAVKLVHRIQSVNGADASTQSSSDAESAPGAIDLTSTPLNFTQPAAASQDTPKKKSVNELQFSVVRLTARAKLGAVTFSYDFVPTNGSYNAAMQLFVDVDGTWKAFSPTDNNGILDLFEGLDNTGSFVVDLPKGKYDGYRILLFDAPDGRDADFSHVIWDSSIEKHLTLPALNLIVTSNAAPVNSPVLAYPPNPLETDEGNGLTTVTIPVLIKYPVGYKVDGGGFWIMAQGYVGFAQAWVSDTGATTNNNPDDPYTSISASLVLKDVKPGLWNAQLGLFNSSWQKLEWTWPGLDFEVGGDSWVTKAAEQRIPPRLKVANNHFELLTGAPYNFYKQKPAAKIAAQFVRGGNYGNAITWSLQPALDTPGYFTLLAQTGCHYIRFNFNPDRYLSERAYQDSVDQVIENIWSAGLYPVIAPQDLPQGSSLSDQVARGDHLMQMIATKYDGRPVWIEVCNEPQEFGSWLAWKPIADQYVKSIRSIDPDAFVIVPFEGFSKDGKDAASSPITDVHVDLYDGHAYINANQVAAAFGPAIKAGLPVMIGEYGGQDGGYLHQMDKSFQALSPAPLAISPWAFTIKGQDSLPLVLDGSTANLVFTPAGQAIADDYNSWDNGRKLQ